jgi:hypothetical protein
MNWNFHFAFPAETVHHQLPLLRLFSAFVLGPKEKYGLQRRCGL